MNNNILEKLSDSAKSYFAYIEKAGRAKDAFPVNLDEVWNVCFKRKDHAVRYVKSKFKPDEDYIETKEKVPARNVAGYAISHKIYLSIDCAAFMFSQKSAEIFEAYKELGGDLHKSIGYDSNNKVQSAELIGERELLGETIRIYGTLENPLFLAKDVAKWIQHSNTSVMLGLVDDDEKVVNNVYSCGKCLKISYLTEYGLYEVIMQSRKPIAKQFKAGIKKILHEIRMNGMYCAKLATPSYQIEDPIERAKTWIKEEEKRQELISANHTLQLENKSLQDDRDKYKEWYNEADKEAEELFHQKHALVKLNKEKDSIITDQKMQLDSARSKVKYYDTIAKTEGLSGLRDTAALLGIRQNQFIKFLLDHNYIYRKTNGDLRGAAEFMRRYFELKETISDSGRVFHQLMVTQNGRRFFVQRMESYINRCKEENSHKPQSNSKNK